MKLYNTLTRQTEVLELLNAPLATVYTCGPTVYDYAHVGHWFTYIRWDLLIRTLKTAGYAPKWVMNITDVGHLVSDADDGEDKLEKGAKREGKTAWEVAKFYTDDFLHDLRALNITEPNFLTKATDHIPEQIELIQKLEQKGFTYVIDDGVYYDTSKFEAYANFAKLDLDDLQAGARVAVNTQKRNPTDFALWKFSPKNNAHTRDMEWDSPWGKGFPGWHIECSAMAMKYLGETIDLHAGGIDHIPVHHTNEIAQSEAATGKRFSNYWLHSNHVTVNGEKISKSLGNGIRLADIEARGISPEAFRLHVFESHYRSQSKFSWESLEAANNRLAAYQATADWQWQANDSGTVQKHTIEAARHSILEALENDLDTPTVLAALSKLETAINGSGINTDSQVVFVDFLEWLDNALGLHLSGRPDISDEQKQLIHEREEARQHQDWALSDNLREQLKLQGITIKDQANTTVWSRV
jgi:cysteinyl-tRNA synthetase